MSRTYHHLSPEDRAVIMIERRNGRSLRSIARLLGRSPSTVSRELKRAGGGSYETTLAAEGYRERRSASRRRRLLAPGTTLYQYVHDRLVYFRWSPQQIAARLREMPESERWPRRVPIETSSTSRQSMSMPRSIPVGIEWRCRPFSRTSDTRTGSAERRDEARLVVTGVASWVDAACVEEYKPSLGGEMTNRHTLQVDVAV